MKKDQHEPEKQPEKTNTEATKPEAEVKKEPTIEEKLIAAEAEIYQLKNKYAMVFADMDNLRKNQDKAFSEALRYRSEGFLDKLIPALESFHIALKNPVDDPKVKNYLIGFEYIYNQLKQALEDEGVKEIQVKIKDAFDVMTMHALDAEVSEGPPNRVIKVLSPGYKLHDRIIKQALVIVSKEKPTENKPNTPPTNESNNGNQAA